MPIKVKKKTSKPLAVSGAVALTAATLPALSLIGLSQKQNENLDQLNDLQDLKDVQEVSHEFKNLNQQTIKVEHERWSRFMPMHIEEKNINNYAHEFGIKTPEKRREIDINFKISNHDNDYGHIDLEVTFKKNKAVQTHEIKLTNFLNNEKFDENQVHFAKYLIEKFLHDKTIGASTKYKNLLPSEFKKLVGTTLDQTHFEELELQILKKVNSHEEVIYDDKTKEIISHLADITYRILKTDDIYGRVTILANIKKNQAKDSFKFEITGFKRNNEQDWEDVNYVANILENENQNVNIGKNSRFYDFFPKKVAEFLKENGIEDHMASLGMTITAVENRRNVKLKYKIMDFDNENGVLNLEITLTKNHAEKKIVFTISGFKNQNDQIKENLNLILQKIPDRIKTNLNKAMPSQAIQFNQKISLKDLGIESFQIANLDEKDITIKALEINDDMGEILIEVTLSQKSITVVKNVTVYGFKTFKDHILEELETIKNLLTNQQTTKNDFLPTEIINEIKPVINPKTLGIKSLTAKELNGTKIIYEIFEFNDDNGEITIEATLTKNDVKVTTKFIVFGFKTTQTKNQEQVNEVLALINDQKTTKNDILPSDLSDLEQIKTAYELGIINPDLAKKLDVKIKYRILKINDDKGLMTVLVLISKGNARAEKEIKITNFQTQKVRDEKDVKETLKNIEDIIYDLIIFDRSKLPSEYKNFEREINYENGVELKIKVLETDDEKGEIKIEINAKKGHSSDQQTKILEGFLTLKELYQKEINDLILSIDNQTTKESNKLASEIANHGQFQNALSLGIEPISDEVLNGASIEYEVIEFNDDLGTIRVRVILKKGQAQKDKEITIKGYLTIESKVKNELKTLIEFLNKKYVSVSLDLNAEEREILPSEIWENYQGILNDKSLEKFNIDKYLNVDQDLKITYHLVDFDDELGTITIKVMLEKKGYTEETEFTVNRFETTVRRQVNISAKFLETNNKNVTINGNNPRWKNKLPSEIIDKIGDISKEDAIELGIRFSSDETIEYGFNLIRSNDDAGTIYLEINVIKNDYQKDVLITIKGFLNNRGYLDLVANNLKEMNQDLKIDKNSPDTKMLPSEIERELDGFLKPKDLKRFNIQQINNLNQVKTTFKITNSNNLSGEITIEIELSRGRASSKIIIYVGGFLKTAQDLTAYEILEKFYYDQNTGLVNKTADEIAQVGDNVSEAQLGIFSPPAEAIHEAKIELIIAEIIAENGQIKVTVRVEKNGDVKTRMIVISAYKVLK